MSTRGRETRRGAPARARRPDTRSGSPRVIHVDDIAFVGSTLVAALRRLGVEARLIDPPRPGHGRGAATRAVLAPLRLASLLAVAPELAVQRPDLVHVHYAWKAFVAPLAGRPFVVHCHGSDVRGLDPLSPSGRFVAALLRSAEAVYYATPDLAADVLPIRPDASFLPNPIDGAMFHPADPPPSRDVLVGTRLDPIKGVDLLVEIVARLVARRPTTTLTAVRHGGRAEALVSAGEGRVQLLEALPHDRMPALYRDHRVALGQLRVGAIGNYELEALASGLPVVARFGYPAAYPVRPPIVSVTDAETAVEEVVRLLDDEGRRSALGVEGASWIRQYHASDVVARRLLLDYERLLRGRTSART